MTSGRPTRRSLGAGVRHAGERQAAIQKIVDGNLAVGFGHAATLALLVSACFAVVAFVLVFALPKRVSQRLRGAPPAE